MTNFRKPSNFNGDVESRVDNLERTQRTQDVELNRLNSAINEVKPSNVFTEWDGVSLTGTSLLSAIGAGVGDVLQAYNVDITSCPAGKLIGRAAGGAAGPAQDITVGSGLTMTTDTLSVPAAGLTLDRIQDINEARLLGRTNDVGAGPVEELSFGVGIAVDAGVVQQDMLFRMLDKDENGQNSATAQPWFPANGTVGVQVATYFFDGVLYLTTGTTSHSLLLKFDSGSATIYSFAYYAIAQSTLESTNAVAQSSTWTTGAGANTVLAASTTAARWVRVVGVVRFSVSGTFVPEFRFSTAPGGTNVVKVNTYFRMQRVGNDAVTSMGNWT